MKDAFSFGPFALLLPFSFASELPVSAAASGGNPEPGPTDGMVRAAGERI